MTAQQFQSTHPVWGATPSYDTPTALSRLFQSTHPVWGATALLDLDALRGSKFQSTHPVWGATISLVALSGVQGISIHAPRVGCDIPLPTLWPSRSNFNPRTPCGVRRAAENEDVQLSEISIHAPRVGCDLIDELHLEFNSLISIHAPRVGCDAPPFLRYPTIPYFNPRTPCGVRPHDGSSVARKRVEFQSTHPVWGATRHS